MSTLIRNGLLADPANGLLGNYNLVVEGGKIAAVTTEAPAAERVIDASGCVVCPGFIDIHMHEDPVGPDGRIQNCIFEAMLRMGVTTAVGGNCGDNIHDPAAYLELVDRHGLPVNLALLAGHGYFRRRAGGLDKYGSISSLQMEDMLNGLRTALDAGCLGISLGLRYIPGMDENELLAAMGLSAAAGKIVSAHVRDDAEYVFDAVEEFARAGRASGAAMQVSHIGSMGGFGQMSRLLAQIEAYRADGLDIACDCYPYTAFSTGIGTTTYDDGWLERYHCDYSACVPAEGRYKGTPCTAETFAELRREDPDCITVCYGMRQTDVDLALMHPAVMLGSDGFVDNGQGHPRAAGSFPRFWHEYVQNGRVSILDGIAKMSSMAAKRLGLSDKGRLNPGADADILIFRPDCLRDRATFDEPMLPPEGVERVIIAGETALEKGEIIHAALGRAVRR